LVFEERGPRTRQSNDEDRVGTIATHTPPRLEELAGAHRCLQAGIALDHARLVATLRLLERIAALVILERGSVLRSILQCLPKRKAEVVAIDERCRACRLFGTHFCKLIVSESIRLEIGEAPIRIAKVWPHGRGCSIRCYGFLLPPERLQRVCHREVQISRLRYLR
jgi:hypothetical protein